MSKNLTSRRGTIADVIAIQVWSTIRNKPMTDGFQLKLNDDDFYPNEISPLLSNTNLFKMHLY